MVVDELEIDAPEGWVATECRFSGNFKLIAEFEHRESGAEVRCRPYKTYSDQPGFCNAHRVILISPDDGVTEIAVGLELEHIDEAEEVVKETMKSI